MREILVGFAEEMETVLKANDWKGGWSTDKCTIHYLEDRLIQEVGEYFKVDRNPKELVDIANFAMMLWTRDTCNKSI